MSTPNAAVKRASDLLGGQSALARALGLKPPTITQWASGERQVPAERCLEIERATAGQVRCEDLRPDVAWDVLRCQADHTPTPAPTLKLTAA